MPPEIGWPLIVMLVAFWLLYRIERKPPYLPPPVGDERSTLEQWRNYWRT